MKLKKGQTVTPVSIWPLTSIMSGGGEGIPCRASGCGLQGSRCLPGGGIQRDSTRDS